MKQITTILLAGAASIFLSACGGGSGTSTSALSFPSDSVLLEPTLENGVKVAKLVTTNQLEGVPILNSINDNSKMNPALLGDKLSQKIVAHVKNSNTETYSLNQVISETIPCLVSGSIIISGSGDIASATLTLTANNCNDGDNLLINGSASASVSNYDSTADNYKDWALKFTTDFTVTDLSTIPNNIAKISKDGYININVSTFDVDGNFKTYKLSTSLQTTYGTEIYGLENCVYFYNINFPNAEMYQTQGKMYFDNLASYVEYDTTYNMSATPFVFLNGVIDSGEARYNMANGGKVRIEVVGGTIYVDVDETGDGTYEFTTTL